MINKFIKSILKQTGIPFRDAKTGVIWSYFLDLVKRLAAEFWTVCSRFSVLWLRQVKRMLQ